MLRKPAIAVVTTALLLIPATAHAADVSAQVAAKSYKNCTALHEDYKHGVGKKGAKDKVTGKSKPVTNFTVSTKVYNLNTKLDRDKDGVACEAR